MVSRLQRAFGDLSIKRKLTLIITCTACLALVLACAGFVLNDVVMFRQVTRDNTAMLATVIGNNSAAALTFDDMRAANEALGTLRDEPHVVGAALYRAGQLFASYRRGAADAQIPASAPAAGWSEGSGRMSLVRQIQVDGQPVGTLYLQRDLRDLHERLNRYFAIAVALLMAASLMAYVLSAGFQRIISEPIAHLVGIMRRVSQEKDFGMRAAGHSHDEVGQLVVGFNEMLAQIQERDAALRLAHGHLEQRVLERTQQLETQIGERLAAERALQQQLTRISLLNQIATALSNRQDLDRIVRTVLEELEKHLPVDFGSVSIFNRKAETLEMAAARWRATNGRLAAAEAAESLAPHGPLDTALEGFGACRDGRLIYLPDTRRETGAPVQRLAEAGLRAVVAVPLLLEHHLFGVLVVGRVADNTFTSGENEFLRMLGEQVAVAASQARLYTELQQAYTELRQSQRTVMQQERLRALGQMASGIAHDINNSLAPVVTFADLLLAQQQEWPEKTRTYLRHIQTAGVDIGKIVSRLREFYRPRDTDEPHLPIDFQALLRQVAELTRPRWRDMPLARGVVIELRTDFAPDVALIAGNESELRESLINLLLNAVDAMPQGGTLTLRTRMRAAAPGKEEVIAEVADTGVGMDDETRSRCLEPFFSTKGQLGTGLGLAMVYGVVERHRGRIEIESAPGAGTTMRLVFPTGTGATNAVAEPAPRARGRPRRVLCVDDEPVLRSVLEELFRLDGHDVAVAEDATTGLRAFREAAKRGAPFEIVITDLGMPHVDGRQFAQAIKHDAPHTPVVLLTGWGKIMKEDGERPATIDAVLSKPPRLEELRRVLAELLGGAG